jgi:antitoxin ParD1/3/4
MTELSKILPPDLESWAESRAAEGEFFDASDYLRELVRRDRAEAEDTAWVREMIADGEASGFMEEDARTVLKGIIAKIPNG